MEKFTTLKGMAAPLPRENISAAEILPAEALKTIHRAGLGKFLFAAERFTPEGRENPGFILNQPAWRKAVLLVAGAGFGAGAVNDHVYWALADFGIRAVIAPSFAPDFAAGCWRHGLLPVTLPPAEAAQVAEAAAQKVLLTVDLERQTVTAENGLRFAFKTDPFQRHCLLAGLDAIGLTLEHEDAIADFEKRQRQDHPWLYH